MPGNPVFSIAVYFKKLKKFSYQTILNRYNSRTKTSRPEINQMLKFDKKPYSTVFFRENKFFFKKNINFYQDYFHNNFNKIIIN
jgi:hypothetical protein